MFFGYIVGQSFSLAASYNGNAVNFCAVLQQLLQDIQRQFVSTPEIYAGLLELGLV
jgi:hypothetical protein